MNRPRESRVPQPRLPRLVEADPRAGALAAHLRARSSALWPGARYQAARISLGRELRMVLLDAQRTGRLVRGLEACDRVLDTEARGQRLVDERSESPRRVRVSRLLLLGSDGAERFYRQAERSLLRHQGRVLGICVEATADELGQLLYGPENPTRAVMLTHKESVSAALLAIAP